MDVSLDYGTGSLSVALPEGCTVDEIVKRHTPVLDDPGGAARAALEQPVESASLSALAVGRRSACILICDITRPVPNGLLLRPMIETLLAAGISPNAITVLVATGLHRPNEGEELRRLIGDDWVLQTVKVENHFARDADAHASLGVTRGRGVPIKLDRRFLAADLRLVTGLVEPHFMAGYSGGRKVIAPGIAHEDTIRTFHTARFMEDVNARQCNLAGNPLHEEQLEIVAAVGEVYAVNTVLDERRRLVFVNFGHIERSHLEAVKFVRDSSFVPVGRRYSTVLTSAAGYPLDQTYYQTVKGMVTPVDILANDASLFIASQCAEGLGSPEFRDAQSRLVTLGPEAFLASIKEKKLAAIDEWQTEMQLKPMRRARIGLYSTGLPEADHALTGVERVQDLSQAIAASIARSGDSVVAVIPEGPYVVPYYEAA
jgi:nickel-dependent lactate racemase